MRDHEDHGVGFGRQRFDVGGAIGGYPWVVDPEFGDLGGEDVRELGAWGVALVVRVGQIAPAQDEDARFRRRPALFAQAAFDQGGDVARHRVVDGAGGRDEARCEAPALGRVRDQEPRVLGDAMAADARTGQEHVPAGAFVQELTNAPDVRAQSVADQGHLVGEADLDVAIRVLAGLDDLGGQRVGRVEIGFDDAAVQAEGNVGRLGRRTPDHAAHPAQVLDQPARHHPLRAVGQQQVIAHPQTR